MIAIVGYGVMGRAHARVLRAKGEDVVTVDPAGHADLTELEPGPLEAVIATPPSQLVDQAAKAQSMGMLTLVEKPVALTSKKAISLNPEQTFVGYVERFNPAVHVLKQNLDRVGSIVHIEARRLGPAGRCRLGPALDLATHDLDVLRYIGLEPVVISRRSKPGHVEIELDRGSLIASHIYPVKTRTLTIVGEYGMLALDYQRQTVDFIYPGGAQRLAVTHGEPLALLHEDWEAAAPLSDALALLEMLA